MRPRTLGARASLAPVLARGLPRATILACALLGACLDRPLGAPPPVSTNLFVESIPRDAVDKIDLLFMIDNSASMADKQSILRLAVPDLVERLVNPPCIDDGGVVRSPPAAGQICPEGQTREFNPVTDINVAVISSSLGDVGADQPCPPTGSASGVPDVADMAHLMGSLERGASIGANEAGFLEWRGGEVADFTRKFERMVQSVGERGCGFEASLESWYRFLIDPYPYRRLVRVPCPGSESTERGCVQYATDAAGNVELDEVLLAQRQAFLRPDSLVGVIMLSDENDCSIRVGGSSWRIASVGSSTQAPPLPMLRGSSACALDPNAKCCYPCGNRPPDGCGDDASCAGDAEAGIRENRLAPEDDGANLRCFQQKRRFGADLLYPTARYVNALREFELCMSTPDLSPEGCPVNDRVPNPLFAGGRDRSLVFLGGVVGVPWQAIASDRDANQMPLANPDTTLRFKTAAELHRDDVWAQIVGSPGVPWRAAAEGRAERQPTPATPPGNPWMVESQYERPDIPPANPINGREYDTAQDLPQATPMDLQYACIFPLPEPVDCALKGPMEQCDCFADDLDRPLCEERPGQTAPTTLQRWSKAYPGLRELEVLRDYGDNSIVASICARNVDAMSQPDFGYRPAMDAVVDRLKERLGDRCLPRSLLTEDDGTVSCTLVEAVARPTGACECDAAVARKAPDDDVERDVRERLVESASDACGPSDRECANACLCEVLQVQDAAADPDEALRACREDESPRGIEGWCYVADTPEQRIGNAELVKDCSVTERRKLRFVGSGLRRDTTTFVSCRGAPRAQALE